MLTLTKPQKVEARKALDGQSYDFMVIRDGCDEEEDLLTDADIAFLCANMKGDIEMTPEHSADVRQRMTDAVPMTPGLDANTLFDRAQRGVKLPKGSIDPYNEEKVMVLTSEQIAKIKSRSGY